MPVIGKHILLIDSVKRRVPFEGISVRILLRQNPLDPNVDREGIHVMQTEQRNAVGDLYSDTVEPGELCNDGFLVFCRQCLQIDFSCQDSICGCLHIFAAVSQPARCQSLL